MSLLTFCLALNKIHDSFSNLTIPDTLHIVNDSMKILLTNATPTKTNILDFIPLFSVIVAFLGILIAFYRLRKELNLKKETTKEELNNQLLIANEQIHNQLILAQQSIENQTNMLIHQLKNEFITRARIDTQSKIKTLIVDFIEMTAILSENTDQVKHDNEFMKMYRILNLLKLELNPFDPIHNELIRLIEEFIIQLDTDRTISIDYLRNNSKAIINLTKVVIQSENKLIADSLTKII